MLDEMTRTIYLDTTIPSYLFDEREELKTFVKVTQQWWTEERQQFDLYLSEETMVELNNGNYSNKSKVLESISGIKILAANQRSVAKVMVMGFGVRN